MLVNAECKNVRIAASILYMNFLRKRKEWDLWFLDAHFLRQSLLPVLFVADNVWAIFTAMGPSQPSLIGIHVYQEQNKENSRNS